MMKEKKYNEYDGEHIDIHDNNVNAYGTIPRHNKNILDDDEEVDNNNTTTQVNITNGKNSSDIGHQWHDLVKPKILSSSSSPSFSKHTTMVTIAISIVILLLLCYTFTILFGELVFLPNDKNDWCRHRLSIINSHNDDDSVDDSSIISSTSPSSPSSRYSSSSPYDNPDYVTDPCRYERIVYLIYLTKEECDLSRRMLASVFLGGAIGYERKISDRPAGIRTMGLVSLGACFFTISSQLSFKSSTMGWDASRVTAAIPSGVGFLGAGLIWKGTTVDRKGADGGGVEDKSPEVYGLTTAASLWLSAAVGVGAGGALYVTTVYATVLVLVILRFGPRMYLQDDLSYADDNDDDITYVFDTTEQNDNDESEGNEDKTIPAEISSHYRDKQRMMNQKDSCRENQNDYQTPQKCQYFVRTLSDNSITPKPTVTFSLDSLVTADSSTDNPHPSSAIPSNYTTDASWIPTSNSNSERGYLSSNPSEAQVANNNDAVTVNNAEKQRHRSRRPSSNDIIISRILVDAMLREYRHRRSITSKRKRQTGQNKTTRRRSRPPSFHN